ncbi:MAG: BglII/BstYI family type II restriction endonuclease [Candidatus Paceibacterota bacterium]|jgi:hypothetical protein
MKFTTHPYKHADIVLADPRHKKDLDDILEVISSISDEELKTRHLLRKNNGIKSSLAPTINSLLKEKLVAKGWNAESSIFQGEEYGTDKVWRLDFARGSVSVEVAFNHGEAIAWNLLKPVLASSVNNVDKAIETEVGILITTTKNLKIAGAFDNAVGEYEKVLRYLIPLSTLMSVPLMIIGLEAPETFKLKSKYPNCDDWGSIIDLKPIAVNLPQESLSV